MCYNSTTCAYIALSMPPFPTSQAELIRFARGDRTQDEFARELGVDRTCLSRYEREHLGAPPSVITHCLALLSKPAHLSGSADASLGAALNQARSLVKLLEAADRPTKQKNSPQRKNNR